MINQRITKLRQLMKERGIDLYIIPTSDFHQSEYVGSYFEARHYMSGFSGSAGTLIVRQEEAYLWTDGRYFIQAEKELAGSCIQLMKMRTPGVPTIKEYIEKYGIPYAHKEINKGKISFLRDFPKVSFNDLSYSLIADDLGAAFGFRSDSVFEILQDSNKKYT